MPTAPLISVVVITLNEGSRVKSTVQQFQNTLPPESEILVVDDGSTDGSTDFLRDCNHGLRLIPGRKLGVAKARNYGARHARGDVLVFADAHLNLSADWWKPLVEILQEPGMGAAAPAIADMDTPHLRGYGLHWTGPQLDVEWLKREGDQPYPVPLLPGGCLAMRRDTFEAVAGFDEGMIRVGSEDSEMSLRLWLLGYELRLAPGVEVAHLFRDEHPYPVAWGAVLHNELRIAFLHFAPQRIARVVEALHDYEGFAHGVALTVESDVAARRSELRSRRVRDDDWFFRRFGPDW